MVRVCGMVELGVDAAGAVAPSMTRPALDMPLAPPGSTQPVCVRPVVARCRGDRRVVLSTPFVMTTPSPRFGSNERGQHTRAFDSSSTTSPGLRKRSSFEPAATATVPEPQELSRRTRSPTPTRGRSGPRSASASWRKWARDHSSPLTLAIMVRVVGIQLVGGDRCTGRSTFDLVEVLALGGAETAAIRRTERRGR